MPGMLAVGLGSASRTTEGPARRIVSRCTCSVREFVCVVEDRMCRRTQGGERLRRGCRAWASEVAFSRREDERARLRLEKFSIRSSFVFRDRRNLIATLRIRAEIIIKKKRVESVRFHPFASMIKNFFRIENVRTKRF